MKKYSLLSLILLLLFVQCGSEPYWENPPSPNDDVEETIFPPGIVVHHSKQSTRVYLGSPSICILPNGDYLVSHDESGPGTVGYPNVTRIYKSTDKGETWKRVASLTDGQTWSGMFLLNSDVYIFGASAATQKCIIRKSTDGGETWTKPVDLNNGIIYSSGCHTSSVPAVIHKGRIWRAIELKDPSSSLWPSMYNAHILSAPLNDNTDLLKSTTWTKSNQLKHNPSYLGGTFGGWLEGNAVVGRDDKVKIVMRVEIPNSLDGEYIAIIDVSDDGKTISFDPNTGFAKMPGGAKKFTIRYDEETDRYWTLSNYVDPNYSYMNPGAVRNHLVLCSSPDLYTWVTHKTILKSDDIKFHAFQYVDWLVDNDDIVFASRTAYDDSFGGADSYHNSNYITFHRVEKFRKYMGETINLD